MGGKAAWALLVKRMYRYLRDLIKRPEVDDDDFGEMSAIGSRLDQCKGPRECSEVIANK